MCLGNAGNEKEQRIKVLRTCMGSYPEVITLNATH